MTHTFAAAILLSAAATVFGAEWSEVGSGLPSTIAGVTSLAIDSATPSTLYAVEAGGRLFKSIDSGGSWKLRGSAVGVNFVAVDPRNSSTIYAATHRGVLKSADGGENWAGANSGLADNYVSMIAIDPVTPATLYAVATRGIFKSTDAARSWNKLDTFSIPNASYYFSGRVTIDPVTPSTIYVDVDLGGANGLVILKSTDGGQSWNRLFALDNGLTLSGLVVDPVTPSTLYAAGRGSILKSADGGQTWTPHPAASPGAAVLSLAIDPASPSTLYAAYASDGGWGILKSTDSGENWSALNTGLPPYADAEFPFLANPVLAVSPTVPATVYAGYFDLQRPGGRLAKSTDGGGSWNAVDTALTYIDVRAVAIDPVIPSYIYAGMGGAADNIPLFKTADGGTSWTSLAQFQLAGSSWYGWISAILAGSASPSLMYAAANSGHSYGAVFKTRDGGANWINTSLRTEGSTVMALDAADPNTVYLGDFDGTGCGQADLDKSVDSGSTWTHSFEWSNGPLNALVIDSRNPATLYAGTPDGVYKSADGGASWSNIGLSMGVTSLALDPGDPNTIYAAAGSNGYVNAGFLGLFKSTDGGASWKPIKKGLAKVLDSRSTVTALAIAPGNRSALYAATSGRGVYKSLNGGAKWTPLNAGLTNLDVRLLAVASNALYAVTSSGIFKAELTTSAAQAIK
jgi:photosystem II stability/assembly factor-like uncharacterized protein